MNFNSNNSVNNTNEHCYVINLRVAEDYVIAYVRRKWVKEGVDHHNLIHTVQTYLEKFVFGIAQSIGKYYSQIESLQLVEDISNIMEFFTVQYSVHNGTTLDDGQLQVQHLKKMVEDYIIQQLTAAMNNHGVFNPTIKRYSVRPQNDKGFLFCC